MNLHPFGWFALGAFTTGAAWLADALAMPRWLCVVLAMIAGWTLTVGALRVLALV